MEMDRKVARFVLNCRPCSLYACVIACSALALAVILRECLDYLGITLYFATFIPAVLLAGVLAGFPASAFVAILAIPIVWWGFLPPVFEFSPLTAEDYHSFLTFFLCSALVIEFAQLCREGIALREQQ